MLNAADIVAEADAGAEARGGMELFTVQAEMQARSASAMLARYYHDGPSDYVTRRSDVYWLDLGLTPRPTNARARYVDDWSPDRYERLGSVFCVPAEVVAGAKKSRSPWPTEAR